MSRRALQWWLVLITIALAQHAHAQQKPAAGALTIGVVLPLSGELGPVGRQLSEAMTLAAAEHAVPIKVVDSAGEPKKAIEAVNELAADPNVVAIVGPIGRRESEAAAVAAQRASVPLFALSSVESVNKLGEWVFRVPPTPTEQAEFVATEARKMGLKRAAVLFPETDYGREAALAFGRAFVEDGGVVAGVGSYPVDTTDFSHPLDAVVGRMAQVGNRVRVGKRRANGKGYIRLAQRRVDFDALFIPDFHQRVARIVAFLPLAGMQNGEGGKGVAVQMLGLSGWHGEAMRYSGAKAAGAIYVDLFAAEATGGTAEEFARSFEQVTGRTPVDIEAQAFDIVWMLAWLSKRLTPAELAARKQSARAALYSTLPRQKPWEGVCGTLAFDRSGAPVRGLRLFRFDTDGAVTPLD